MKQSFANRQARDIDEEANEATALLGKKPGAPSAAEDNKIFMWLRIWGMVIFLIILGTVSMHHIEDLGYVTSLYVVAQMITTVGYGDFTVHSDTMKFFCAFYAVLLLVFGAYAFEQVFDFMRTRSAEVMRHRLLNPESNSAFKDSLLKFAQASVVSGSFVAFGTVFYATYENCVCSYGASHVEGCKSEPYETCVATGGYVKSWVASFYMSVITLTTIGFGDHSPRSFLGRIVGSAWMLLGVAAVANWFTCCSKLFFEYSHQKRIKVTEEVSEELFNRIDKDGSGSLSRAEFRGYFLVKNKLVSEEDLALIDKHFDKLQEHAPPGHANAVTFEMIKQNSKKKPT